MSQVSPLAGSSPVVSSSPSSVDTIITITPVAHAKLIELRDAESERERLGLRLEILSGPGEDFRYDLVFDEFVKAAFTDEVRTINGLKIIIGAKDLDLLRDAELDHDDAKGLLIRNPNKPLKASFEGLVADDEISAQIEAIVFNDVNPALSCPANVTKPPCADNAGLTSLKTIASICAEISSSATSPSKLAFNGLFGLRISKPLASSWSSSAPRKRSKSFAPIIIFKPLIVRTSSVKAALTNSSNTKS